MKNKKIVALIAIFVVLAFAARLYSSVTHHPQIQVSNPEPTPTPIVQFTQYHDQKYGFSFAYPSGWEIPQSQEILPLQEHVYQMDFQPEGVRLNLYNQMLPVPSETFLRDYFKTQLLWTDELAVDGTKLQAFQFKDDQAQVPYQTGFVISRGKYVLTVTRAGQIPKDQLTADQELIKIAQSVTWSQ
jgi:hypothetical protein